MGRHALVAGTFVLLMALVAHMSLALLKLVNRSTLRLPPWELIQIILGLLIPFLAAAAHRQHARRPGDVRRGGQLPLRAGAAVAGQRAAAEHAPRFGLVARLSSACTTGCDSIRLIAPRSLCCCFVAIALPLAALGGFMVSGRAVALLIEKPEMFGARQGADQLAQRSQCGGAGQFPDHGAAWICRRAAAGGDGDRLALLPVQHPAEAGDQIHRRADR
jgi:hypothetical protein